MRMRNPVNVGLFFTVGFLFLQIVGGEFRIADSLLEGKISELLSPLYEATHQLEDLVNDFEFKKAELNSQKENVKTKLSQSPKDCNTGKDLMYLMYHSSLFLSWSFDDCVKFTDDLSQTTSVIWNAGLLIANITQSASQIGNNILNCPSLTVVKTVKCYNDNLKALKNLVNDAKTITEPTFEECKEAIQKTRLEFDYCIGIPVKSQVEIDKHLKNC